MSARLFVDGPLVADRPLDLPEDVARHVQVLRLQPGDRIVLFDGGGGEWQARVEAMGRRSVTVRPEVHHPVERELRARVVLAVGVPANERFDWLVEKATELGVAAIQPLLCERSVVRLDAERGRRKQAHWAAVARAAAEQSGRTRVPSIEPPAKLLDFLGASPPVGGLRGVLSLADDARPLRDSVVAHPADWCLLSGPEGGLSATEEAAARAAGFQAWTLGRRTLRAETAPLAALAAIALAD